MYIYAYRHLLTWLTMPSTSVTADPVAVANRLRPVLLQLARELRREIHSLGVTGGQVSLLVQIERDPGIGVRELAARERMSPAGMSKYVGRLEAAGLLERTALPDKRRVGLRLTGQAERVLRSVRHRRTAWLAARLRELDDHDRAAIERALDPLARLLEVRL